MGKDTKNLDADQMVWMKNSRFSKIKVLMQILSLVLWLLVRVGEQASVHQAGHGKGGQVLCRAPDSLRQIIKWIRLDDEVCHYSLSLFTDLEAVSIVSRVHTWSCQVDHSLTLQVNAHLQETIQNWPRDSCYNNPTTANLSRELLPFVELLLKKFLHRFQALCHTTIHGNLSKNSWNTLKFLDFFWKFWKFWKTTNYNFELGGK